jgi:pyruvate,water dikinase
MMKIGLAVPRVYYCDWRAYQRYSSNDETVLGKIEHELKGIIQPDGTYAIRSSANMEDSEDHSFAGQFDTVLNVKGIPAVLDAIQIVWESVNSPIVHAYLERRKIPADNLRMAVLIQEMVSPVYSGVALSKNPVTGADEIIVEAVTGEGSRLVQDGYTPYRWVNKWGYWLEKDEDSPVELDLIQKIVDQVKDLAARVDYPIDTEWVYDGKTVYWVQMREITSIKKHNVYSNHMAKEMLPGMVKPLPFQVSSQISSQGILRWLQEMLGPIPLDPKFLVKDFHYRAYFNMAALGTIFKSFGFPAESMEMLLGVLPPSAVKMRFKPSFKTFTLAPQALYFLLNRIGFQNRMRTELEGLESRVFASERENIDNLAIPDLLARIERHYRTAQDVIYHT